MQRMIGCGMAIVLILAAAAQAEPVIVVGDHLLLPNTPNQTIQIFVSGDVPVQGMNFSVVVGDGGSLFGGVDDVVPKITADILTGTIFAAHGANAVNQNPTGAFGVGLAAWSITTLSGTVNTNGLLATLNIDTTGFGPFWWTLNMDSPNVGTTDFAGISATITNGHFGTLVDGPEPSSLVLGLLAGAGLGVSIFRKRSQRVRLANGSESL